MNATRTIWTLTDEKIYLDGLGNWGNRRRNRATLLGNYIATAKQRRRWFSPSGSQLMAINYARNLLKTEGR